MTLRRLHLLIQRRADAERRADLRAGVLAATVARIAGSKNVKPSDFFPSLASDAPQQSGDPMAAKLENLRAYLMRQNLLRERHGDRDHKS